MKGAHFDRTGMVGLGCYSSHISLSLGVLGAEVTAFDSGSHTGVMFCIADLSRRRGRFSVPSQARKCLATTRLALFYARCASFQCLCLSFPWKWVINRNMESQEGAEEQQAISEPDYSGCRFLGGTSGGKEKSQI